MKKFKNTRTKFYLNDRTVEKQLKQLSVISDFYGVDPEYVIAGGGNTSFKNDLNLWIKASGIPLAGITADGFVCLSREKLKVISGKTYSSDSAERESEVKTDLNNAIVSDTGKRPSVETSLHELISYSFVVHTHPTLVNSLMCSINAGENVEKLFGKEVVFIEYIDPGYTLFKEVAKRIAAFENEYEYTPKIIFLENHGVFVSGNTTDEIKKLYSMLETKISEQLSAALPSISCKTFDADIANTITEEYPESDKMTFLKISCDLTDIFVKDKTAFDRIATSFTPDHCVYCKSRYLFTEENDSQPIAEKLSGFKEKFGYSPKIIGIEGKGLLIVEESEAAANIVKDLIINMMKISFHARSFGGSKSMTNTQIAFIENWEAENYREKMARK